MLPTVVKKDGRRETFDRQKLIDGLRIACNKRPVSVEQIEAMADAIEREVQERGDKEVSSSRHRRAGDGRLREADEVAYVRFASVYRSFRDIDEFMAELGKLVKAREDAPVKCDGMPDWPSRQTLAMAQTSLPRISTSTPHDGALASTEARARGIPRPNPHVGAVVAKGKEVVADGHHERAGEDHAEVHRPQARRREGRGAPRSTSRSSRATTTGARRPASTRSSKRKIARSSSAASIRTPT